MVEVARSISHDEHIVGVYSLEGVDADKDAEDEEPQGDRAAASRTTLGGRECLWRIEILENHTNDECVRRVELGRRARLGHPAFPIQLEKLTDPGSRD